MSIPATTLSFAFGIFYCGRKHDLESKAAQLHEPGKLPGKTVN